MIKKLFKYNWNINTKTKIYMAKQMYCKEHSNCLTSLFIALKPT